MTKLDFAKEFNTRVQFWLQDSDDVVTVADRTFKLSYDNEEDVYQVWQIFEDGTGEVIAWNDSAKDFRDVGFFVYDSMYNNQGEVA